MSFRDIERLIDGEPLPAALVCGGIGRPASSCATTTASSSPMSISRTSRGGDRRAEERRIAANIGKVP